MSPSLRRRRREPADQSAAGSGATASTTAPGTAPTTAIATEDPPAASGAGDPTAEPPPAPAPEPGEPPTPKPAPERPATRERRRTLAHATPVLLLRAAHPRLAALVTIGMAVAAALAGRPSREVALVAATVLVGQVLLGWLNDLVDQKRDATRLPSGKPIADGYLDPGTVWFALICGVLLLVPLAISNGVIAGCLYLGFVLLGAVSNLVLRTSWLSWVPWAASFALLPGFLSYGGWGGQDTGSAPQPAMVALAAALGVGVHVLCALPGLVADHEDGRLHLPLRIALRTGATRLLVISLAWTALAIAGLLVVGDGVGLSR